MVAERDLSAITIRLKIVAGGGTLQPARLRCWTRVALFSVRQRVFKPLTKVG